jgi:hypothetical protein
MSGQTWGQVTEEVNDHYTRQRESLNTHDRYHTFAFAKSLNSTVPRVSNHLNLLLI